MRIESDYAECEVHEPGYSAPELYNGMGWLEFLSYRIEAEQSTSGAFVFLLSGAVPYAVDDDVLPDVMEELWETLTTTELTRLFLPGAIKPYGPLLPKLRRRERR